MTRHFTIPKMFRMTPNALLQEFFARLDVNLVSMDWKRLKERQTDPLQLALGWIPREQQALAESTLADIFELACAKGWEAILDAARLEGEADIADKVPDGACHYTRAMWTWLHYPAVFYQAATVHQLGGLTHWRKRTGLPVLVPRITPSSVRELEVGLAQCLKREEGRGHKCTVEYYRQGDGTDYFVAYPDDFVQTVTIHDESGNLVPKALRATFEIVFALRAAEGALDLYARVSSAVKPKLESVFGQIILGADLGLNPYNRPYDLNRLKDRYFCLETDPIDRVTARISKLRLLVPSYGKFTVEPDTDGPSADIYEFIDECVNAETVRWEEVKITLATFRFEFHADQRRPSTLTCDVTYPDRCSIKSHRPERIELTRKYLRRWRIANV